MTMAWLREALRYWIFNSPYYDWEIQSAYSSAELPGETSPHSGTIEKVSRLS
jgi:hypothetical protein